MVFVAPLMVARTFCRLGLQVLLVLLLAWETLFPTPRRFAHI